MANTKKAQTPEQEANTNKMLAAAEASRIALKVEIKKLETALQANTFISDDRKTGLVVDRSASTLEAIVKAKEAMTVAAQAVQTLKSETGTKGRFTWFAMWTRSQAFSVKGGGSEQITKLEKATDKLILDCQNIIKQFDNVRTLTLAVNRQLTTAAIALQGNVNDVKAEVLAASKPTQE